MLEESLPPLLADPVAHIIRILGTGVQRTLIALAGLPGSGKSTMAVSLTSRVDSIAGEGAMCAVSMDGFHLTRLDLAAMPDPAEALRRRGAPWTFDPAGMAEKLRLLRSSVGTVPVKWPDFQHGVGDHVPDAISIGPEARIVLVEGLYVAYNEGQWGHATELFDERWFLDTSFEVSLERLTKRHMLTRHISQEEAEIRISGNDKLNAELTYQTRHLCDWRVQ